MKISIITVNYNDSDGIEKTLRSNVELRVPANVEKEIIVIDGGSTDGSVEAIKKYEQSISYWCSEPDRGIFHAMNKGVAAATGDYCIFMNSGDAFASEEVLEKIFTESFLSGEQADVLSGATYYYDAQTQTKELGFPPEKVSMGFFYSKTLQHQSSFIKTEQLRKFPYDETLKIIGDIKFWIQCLILNGGTYASSSVPVAEFNLSGVAARPKGAEKKELRRVFSDLNLDKIILDYDLIMKPKNLKMRICKHFFKQALREILKF